jgi:hypothetical protein
MFAHTDIKQVAIPHLLSLIAYEDLTPKPRKLPPRDRSKYVRLPIHDQSFNPEVCK